MSPQLLPIIAFIATMAFIFVLRPLAIRIGLTDRPDTRKTHTGEVPLVGGVAIYLALLVVVLLDNHFGLPPIFGKASIHAFLTASGLLVLVGVLDDRSGLSPLLRFLAQVIAAMTMVFGAGSLFTDLGALTSDGSTLYLGLFGMPFTILVTVGVINAINMCDGLDGLSGNMTLVSFLGLGLANTLWGSADHLPLLNVLSAGVIGFLTFNQRMWFRNKAWVFLGDAGSMMLGLALVWMAIDISQGGSRAMSPSATAWFLAIPVFDTVTMIIRRISQGRSPFHADAEHLHHLLVRLGFRVGQAIAMMCCLAALGCAIGLALTYFAVPDPVVIGLFTATGFLYLAVIQWSWYRIHKQESA